MQQEGLVARVRRRFKWLKSRTEMIRRALAAYLAGAGEGEVAGMFETRG